MKPLCIIIYILLLSSTSFATINIKVARSPISNLIYQLNCVSTHSQHCNYQAYAKLWENNFLQSEKDKKLIHQWQTLLAKFNNKDWFEQTNLSQPLHIASLHAQNLNSYFEKLAFIPLPRDKEKIKNIISHFYPAFIQWWNKEAKLKTIHFKLQLQQLLEQQMIATKINQFANFYVADLPNDSVFTINLIYSPHLNDTPQHGEQIENYATIEFYPQQKPELVISIALHELCHFFFNHSNKANLVKLQNDFAKFNSLEATAAYNLMNEVVATALNQGMINYLHKTNKEWEIYLKQSQSFYDNNCYLDKAAKSLLPMLTTWLQHKKTIFTIDFVEQYLKTLKDTFKNELLAPKVQLMQMNLYTNSKKNGLKFRDYITKLFAVSFLYVPETSTKAKESINHPNSYPLNSLIILCPEKKHAPKLKIHDSACKPKFVSAKTEKLPPVGFNEIANMKLLPPKQLASIEQEYNKHGKAIFSYKTTPAGIMYVIVAKDQNTIFALLKILAELKTGFIGFLQLNTLTT